MFKVKSHIQNLVSVLIHQIRSILSLVLTTTISGMDEMVMEEEDDCPELVPIDALPAPPADQIPVTIITGYLGERLPVLLRALRCL